LANYLSFGTQGVPVSVASVQSGAQIGEYVVSGQIANDGQLDIFIERHDAAGGLLWYQIIDGPAHGDDYAHEVAVNSDGTAIYLGAQVRQLSTGGDAWLRRFDAQGNTRWTVTVDGPLHDNDDVYGIAVDPAGGVVVAGVLRGDMNDAWVARYADDGTLRWSHTYDGPVHQNDAYLTVALDSNGNAICGGYTMKVLDPTYLNTTGFLRSFSRGGALNWSVELPASTGGGSGVNQVVAAGDEDLYAATVAYLAPAGGALVRGQTAQGTVISTWEFSDRTPRSLAIATHSNLYVGGNLFVGDNDHDTVWLAKVSNQGAWLWSTTDGAGRANGIALAKTGIVGVGYRKDTNGIATLYERLIQPAP
jgi:hypothetical protein